MAVAAGVYLVLRLAGFHELFVNDAEGMGALLEIIGTLYRVVYAFATYVIWGQFAAVENEILKESGALKDLIVFSKGLKEATRDPTVRSVRAYARAVTESEWGMLSRGEDSGRTDKLFSGIISSVTDATATDESERRAHDRLLEIANRASGHRDERLALSVKRIPRTLLLFVTLTACTILFLLFSIPFTTWRWASWRSRSPRCCSAVLILCSRTWIIRLRAPGTSTPSPLMIWPQSIDSSMSSFRSQLSAN